MNIERLTRRIEDRREARERIAMREVGYKEHVKVIKEAYEETLMDFWCDKCKKDFSTTGKKQVRHSGRWPVAWYVGLCPKKHVAIRHITDKNHDPYYGRSEMMKKQRAKLADAMLTPDDPRFALVYPQKYRELQALKDKQ